MPAGYEGGLRLVEHYLGRSSATKQTRGFFPCVSEAPTIDPGRVVRNYPGRLTGTAAQVASTVSTHGVRPTVVLPLDAKPEDMLLPLMAFFHNRKYTQTTPPGSGLYRELGLFQFGMPTGMPDHTGVVVGDFDPDGATYNDLVTLADIYSFGVEWLHGHGHLGDTDNGASVDNVVVNKLIFDVQRGVEQYLKFTAEGFGRDADELEDLAVATWGAGINGDISTQALLTPDKVSFTTFELNDVDVASTWTDWIDALTIEAVSGIGGRDPLGADSWSSLETQGRPALSGSITVAHVDPGFLEAVKEGYKFAFTAKFTNSANEYVTLTCPYLKFHESFTPDGGDVNRDVTGTIPFIGVIDTAVASPLFQVDVKTLWDVRTLSFDGASLAVYS